MRQPSTSVIVDANIVVSAVMGRKTGPAVNVAASRVRLVTSARAADEAVTVVTRLTQDGSEERLLAAIYLQQIDIIPDGDYRTDLPKAAACLQNAVASRNGSTDDAHLLALAWLLSADIWSHDRDFAGTGWPSWSTANLLSCLAAEPAPDTV